MVSLVDYGHIHSYLWYKSLATKRLITIALVGVLMCAPTLSYAPENVQTALHVKCVAVPNATPNDGSVASWSEIPSLRFRRYEHPSAIWWQKGLYQIGVCNAA
jgi:hypothetical protein